MHVVMSGNIKCILGQQLPTFIASEPNWDLTMSQELDCLHNHQESPRTSRGAKVVGDKTLGATEEIAVCAIVRPTMGIVRPFAFPRCGGL